MRTACRTILSILALPVLIAPSEARAESVDSFLARLGAQGRQTRSLEARFTQRKRAALFKSEVKTRGVIYFEPPDRLRWESFAPDAATLLVRGSRAELRLPGEAPRALDLKAGGALAALCNQLLVWLGARPASELKQHYEIKLEPAADAGTRLRLSPKAGALRKHVSALTLGLDRSLQLQRIEVEQPGGDRTTIELAEIQRNRKLPAAAFR
jgi:outer membrane lipoprotein-sorting protein